MAQIAIIGGAGYVGLTYAVAFTELGHEVVALDIDPTKVSTLLAGRSPIYAPGLDELLQRGLASGCLRFTTEYADAVPGADFAFLCVGTPTAADGGADMTYVRAAARSVAEHATGHVIVVNKSTVPVGSATLVAHILAEHAAPGATFAVVSNPEFVAEGVAIQDIFNPDRIVVGSDDPVAGLRVAALYAALNAPVVVTDPASAEMIKYASNAFLATKISFINEVAAICERLGADVTEVARGVGLDGRIGQRFLRAGAGFGGSCFPKDVRALGTMARHAGVEPRVLDAVLAVNASARDQVVAKVIELLGGVRGKTIAILGLAFKPDTDDVRDAPALDIIRRLVAAGARVKATDPVAMPHVARLLPEAELAADAYAAAADADAIVLVTEWAGYRGLDLARLAAAMRGRLVVDGRNALSPTAVAAAGLIYVGVGRATPAAAAAPTLPVAFTVSGLAQVDMVALALGDDASFVSSGSD